MKPRRNNTTLFCVCFRNRFHDVITIRVFLDCVSISFIFIFIRARMRHKRYGLRIFGRIFIRIFIQFVKRSPKFCFLPPERTIVQVHTNFLTAKRIPKYKDFLRLIVRRGRRIGLDITFLNHYLEDCLCIILGYHALHQITITIVNLYTFVSRYF